MRIHTHTHTHTRTPRPNTTLNPLVPLVLPLTNQPCTPLHPSSALTFPLPRNLQRVPSMRSIRGVDRQHQERAGRRWPRPRPGGLGRGAGRAAAQV